MSCFLECPSRDENHYNDALDTMYTSNLLCACCGRGFKSSHPVHFFLLYNYGIGMSSFLNNCRTKSSFAYNL